MFPRKLVKLVRDIFSESWVLISWKVNVYIFANLGNCMESEGVVPLNNAVFDPKMTNHTIDIYYFAMSPPCRAALMVIKALGIKHNVKMLNLMEGEHLKPDFLKLNPLHTVPTITDKDFILYESNVIMKYFATQYAKDDSLYPKDPKKSAVVDQRLYFNALTLFPRLREFAIPVIMFGNSPDLEKKKVYEDAMKVLEQYLDNQIWVAGQYITIADFAIISTIASAEAMGQWDLTQYPNISTWYQRCQNAMAGFGYEEINQAGANIFGNAFKNHLKD